MDIKYYSYYYENHDNTGNFSPKNVLKTNSYTTDVENIFTNDVLTIDILSKEMGNNFTVFYITDKQVSREEFAKMVVDNLPENHDIFSYITAEVVMSAEQQEWVKK